MLRGYARCLDFHILQAAAHAQVFWLTDAYYSMHAESKNQTGERLQS